MEVWKAIPGYPEYEVSDLGRVRSLRRNIVMRLYRRPNGYVSIQMGRLAKAELVHRLVLLAFLGPNEQRPWVNHKNGVRHDNRLENLEWNTPSENILHKYHVLKAPHPRGAVKLTLDEVLAIQNRVQAGERRKAIAAEFKTSRQTVDRIAARQTWTHVLTKSL